MILTQSYYVYTDTDSNISIPNVINTNAKMYEYIFAEIRSLLIRFQKKQESCLLFPVCVRVRVFAWI